MMERVSNALLLFDDGARFKRAPANLHKDYYYSNDFKEAPIMETASITCSSLITKGGAKRMM